MPANGFNIGRDLTLDIVDPANGVQRWRIITSSDFEPEYKELRSEAMDGTNRFAYLPAGHKLSFQFDRGDSSVDDYFVAREADYFNGVPIPACTITETITNPDSSVSQYRYSGVALKLTKRGNFKGDSIVTQTVDAMAARITKVA